MVGQLKRQMIRAIALLLPGIGILVFSQCANSLLDSIKSVNAQNSASQVVPAAPGAPTIVVGNNQLTVSWSAVLGTASYNVYWSLANDKTTIPASRHCFCHRDERSHDPQFANGQTYVWVIATNSHGSSGYSLASLSPSQPAARTP